VDCQQATTTYFIYEVKNVGLLDSTITNVNQRFNPTTFETGTTGGSRIDTSQTGPDRFKAGIFLDPDIRGLRGEELSGIRNLLSSIQGERGSILDARLRPLEENLAGQTAGITRDLARRNVFGSLRNNEINNSNRSVQRQLGDARALANNDLINVESRLNAQIGESANELFGQELSTLGLSQNAINTIINSMRGGGSTQTESDPGGTLEGIGNVLDFIFGLGGSGGGGGTG
jgi:hypothetical protein